jgi:hypothetical protein
MVAWGRADVPTTGPVDGPIPPLTSATCEVLPNAPPKLVNPFFVHEGRFTCGKDLLQLDLGLAQASWPAGCVLNHAASPLLQTRLTEAVGAAADHQKTLTDDKLGGAVVEFLGGTAPVTSSHQDFLGYRPLRARWLGSQWKAATSFLFPDQKYVYPDYYGFQDVRQRAARLYCAARAAQRVQGDSVPSMGERVGFSVKILGHTIDFLVVESTVVLGGPERFLGGSRTDGGAADGTWAFSVPLFMGTRVTPVRGLPLPGFSEVRAPLALVSGDSEVRTATDKRKVLLGQVIDCTGNGCALKPYFVEMHSKEYRTVTHADALLTAGKRTSLARSFPVFFVGPLEISLGLGLDYEVGQFTKSFDRVLNPKGLGSGWPTSIREGSLFEDPLSLRHYHDGPWLFGHVRPSATPTPVWHVLEEGKTDPFWRAPWLPFPYLFRVLTDDDHAVASTTRLEVSATLSGHLPLEGDFGAFKVTPHVSGTLSGSVFQSHVVRDALTAQDPLDGSAAMRPITALTVRPRAQADITFKGLSAGLEFELDLPFGDIEFTKTFFNVGAKTLASYDSDDHLNKSDEQFMLRLGTGSRDGVPMSKPKVASHLPQGEEFEPFDEQDVAACLADEQPNLPVPPECEPTESTGEPPRAELCLIGPTGTLIEALWAPLPPGVCGGIQAYANIMLLTPDQKTCVVSYLSFLCEPVSDDNQTWNGFNVVSRVWNLDPAMNAELQAILAQCAEAYGYQDPISATPLAEGLVSAAVCREDATLIPEEQIIEAVNPTKPPAAKPGPACQD